MKDDALGRWLAEAVRYDETAFGAPDKDIERAAIERARASEGSLSARIIIRAGHLPMAARLLSERQRLSRLLRLSLVATLFIAAIIGALTARTAMAAKGDATINFYWIIFSLLGLHGLSLTLWLILLAFSPKGGEGGLLGRWVLSLWRTLATHLSDSRYRLAALQASVARITRGSAGKWLASLLSHLLWCGFFIGATMMIVLLLSAQRYIFIWETTILSSDAYVSLTQALAALPHALGLSVPDVDQIKAAEWPGSGSAGRIWSTLLVASLILYGLIPRFVAAVICLGLFYRAKNRTPLDLSRPGFARLIPLISPMVTATMVVDPDNGDSPRWEAKADIKADIPPAPPGPIHIMGWEMDAPATGWPPTIGRAQDLGLLDSRTALQSALLQAQNTSRFVIALSLTQSPDRGVSAVLKDIADAIGRDKIMILLTGEDRAKRRLGDVGLGVRLGDWITAVHEAGIEGTHLIACDLDQIDSLQRQRLARLLGGDA